MKNRSTVLSLQEIWCAKVNYFDVAFFICSNCRALPPKWYQISNLKHVMVIINTSLLSKTVAHNNKTMVLVASYFSGNPVNLLSHQMLSMMCYTEKPQYKHISIHHKIFEKFNVD